MTNLTGAGCAKLSTNQFFFASLRHWGKENQSHTEGIFVGSLNSHMVNNACTHSKEDVLSVVENRRHYSAVSNTVDAQQDQDLPFGKKVTPLESVFKNEKPTSGTMTANFILR